MWNSEANYAFQLYNHQPGVSPPIDTPSPQISPGLVNQALTSNEEMKQTGSLFDASRGALGSERSGVAIQALVSQGNIANFAYSDN